MVVFCGLFGVDIVSDARCLDSGFSAMSAEKGSFISIFNHIKASLDRLYLAIRL